MRNTCNLPSILLLVLLVFPSLNVFAFESPELGSLAIQDGGRVKPFDTFARESVQLLTGTQNFKAEGGEPREAAQIVLSWLILPEEWQQRKFIVVNHQDLKRDLGFPIEQKYFSPVELAHNDRLMSLFNQLSENSKQGKKNSPYLQKVGQIGNQLSLFEAIVSGKALRLMPSSQSQDWVALSDLPEQSQGEFLKITAAFAQSVKEGNGAPLNQAAKGFKEFAKAQAPEKYPSDSQINRELWYNAFHPFRKAWIIYLLSALVLVLGNVLKKKSIQGVGMGLVSLGMIINVSGFVIRCVIAGRPPVSNMYESVIWVSSGMVFFGLIFSAVFRKTSIMAAALVPGIIGMIVADSLPAVLDQSIKPLEPVLRSNYWLTIHVLTITLSYAAFGLALGIGNFALGFSIFSPKKAPKAQQVLAGYVYRVLQVGVVLLTAGTILGGVWADYSWGRFWGWDPKETWALIALLCYLAVLHGRFAGWINTFRLHATSVLCFAAVIMAWYGVNFVLGVGLHSYGFGAGGVQYMAAGVGLQMLYVALASARQRKAV